MAFPLWPLPLWFLPSWPLSSSYWYWAEAALTDEDSSPFACWAISPWPATTTAVLRTMIRCTTTSLRRFGLSSGSLALSVPTPRAEGFACSPRDGFVSVSGHRLKRTVSVLGFRHKPEKTLVGGRFSACRDASCYRVRCRLWLRALDFDRVGAGLLRDVRGLAVPGME